MNYSGVRTGLKTPILLEFDDVAIAAPSYSGGKVPDEQNSPPRCRHLIGRLSRIRESIRIETASLVFNPRIKCASAQLETESDLL